MALEAAVEATLEAGYGTPDVASAAHVVSTRALGEKVRCHLGDESLLTDFMERSRVSRQ